MGDYSYSIFSLEACLSRVNMLLSFTCLQLAIGPFGFSTTSWSTDENFLLKLLSDGHFPFSTCVLAGTTEADRSDTFSSCLISEH